MNYNKLYKTVLNCFYNSCKGRTTRGRKIFFKKIKELFKGNCIEDGKKDGWHYHKNLDLSTYGLSSQCSMKKVTKVLKLAKMSLELTIKTKDDEEVIFNY